MRRSVTWLGFLTTLTLLVAACGGDDTLSAEAYFGALEEIDAALDAREDEVLDTFIATVGDGEPDIEAEVAFLDGNLAALVDARTSVAALAVPRELVAAHDAFVESADALIAEVQRAIARVEAGEDFATVFEGPPPAVFDEFDRVCATLQQLGLDRGIDVALSCAD